MEFLYPVLAISGIASGLAALLVIAQRFIADYGDCEIVINDDRKLTVRGGETLLESLTSNKIFVPSACGGQGTCAYCKVKVIEGAGPITPVEEPYLDEQERADGVRLSCQVKVKNDISIQIPEELFSVREFQARCSDIVDLTHDIKQFTFELNEPVGIDFTAGQYIQLFCPVYDGNEEVYRAYSVASDPQRKNSIKLCIRLVPGGICTTWCFNYLKEGDDVKFNGPYGEFRLAETDAPMIFIAGGSGMAPFGAILDQLVNEGSKREALYFFGANRVNELFYLQLMREYEAKLPGFRFIPVVANDEEEWDGERGLVTQAIPRLTKDLSGYEGYLCGSPGMIDASIAVLAEGGIKEEHVFFDKF